MPYIKQNDRPKFEDILTVLESKLPEIKTEGELNYLITKICYVYLQQKGLKYATINAIIGALECIKQEFYRKIASPYEEKKEKQNGAI